MKNNTPKTGRLTSQAIYNQFVQANIDLQEQGGLPNQKIASKIWDEIWLVEAHNSTALEGNTLPLSEVRILLEQNRVHGSKKLQEYMEVIGYARAAKWVYAQGNNPFMSLAPKDWVTMTELRYIHEQLVSLVWEVSPPVGLLDKEGAGSFRQHDIKAFEQGMKPPTFDLVMPLMLDFLKEVNKNCNKINQGVIDKVQVPLFLAKMHNEFEQIHPFRDGNGRTGRLIMNLVLVRLGFPPCIILKSRRIQYLKGMQMADKGNYNKLAEIIARGVLDNIHRFIIPQTLDKYQLVPLESLVTKQISYAALRQAALRGRLKAKLTGNNRYLTTQNAVNEYLSSKYIR